VGHCSANGFLQQKIRGSNIVTINLDYDPELNILFASYPGVRLETAENVARFFQAIEDKLKTLPKKVYVVADLTGFDIDARIAEIYGRHVAEMHEKYVLAQVRYNVADGFPKLSLRLASLKAGRPAHIVTNKAEALAEVEKLKAELKN
jgi:hypothetical protein